MLRPALRAVLRIRSLRRDAQAHGHTYRRRLETMTDQDQDPTDAVPVPPALITAAPSSTGVIAEETEEASTADDAPEAATQEG